MYGRLLSSVLVVGGLAFDMVARSGRAPDVRCGSSARMRRAGSFPGSPAGVQYKQRVRSFARARCMMMTRSMGRIDRLPNGPSSEPEPEPERGKRQREDNKERKQRDSLSFWPAAVTSPRQTVTATEVWARRSGEEDLSGNDAAVAEGGGIATFLMSSACLYIPRPPPLPSAIAHPPDTPAHILGLASTGTGRHSRAHITGPTMIDGAYLGPHEARDDVTNSCEHRPRAPTVDVRSYTAIAP